MLTVNVRFLNLSQICKQTTVLLLSVVCFFMPQSVFAAEFMVAGVRLKKDVKTMQEVRRKNVVMQTYDYSCGAAGLSTMFNYYLNDPVSELEIINTLLEMVPLEKIKQRKGFSLYDLKKFAESKGYKVTGYKMDMEYLSNQKRPVLVPIKFRNFHHFVIVKAVMADRVFIADPASGNMSMKISKFKSIWKNGIALVVDRADQDIPDVCPMEPQEEDFIIANHQWMKRVVDPKLIRTAVFPHEF